MIPLRTKFDTQTTVNSHRRRKRFSSSAGLLFRSEFSDRRHNTGFGDKSIVFLRLPRKFRAGQLSLLSINFDIRNVIFQPMVSPFVWAKQQLKIYETSLEALLSSAARGSLARSRAARFARPNRKACSRDSCPSFSNFVMLRNFIIICIL